MPPGGSARGLIESAEPRRWVLLAMALALVTSPLVLPTAQAIHDNVGVSPGPWVQDCEGGWSGVSGGPDDEYYRLCYHYDWRLPGLTVRRILQDVEVPPNATQGECPEGFDGYVLKHEDTEVGACVTYDHRLPTRAGPGFHVDLGACEVPGERNGSDPAVRYSDGGAAVCLVPILEPGYPTPAHNVSLEPCEPETVDPEVRLDDGHATVCLDVHVLGYGASEVNYVLDLIEATIEVVIGLLPITPDEAYQEAWDHLPRGLQVIAEFLLEHLPVDPPPS